MKKTLLSLLTTAAFIVPTFAAQPTPIADEHTNDYLPAGMDVAAVRVTDTAQGTDPVAAVTFAKPNYAASQATVEYPNLPTCLPQHLRVSYTSGENTLNFISNEFDSRELYVVNVLDHALKDKTPAVTAWILAAMDFLKSDRDVQTAATTEADAYHNFVIFLKERQNELSSEDLEKTNTLDRALLTAHSKLNDVLKAAETAFKQANPFPQN